MNGGIISLWFDLFCTIFIGLSDYAEIFEDYAAPTSNGI